MTWIPGRTGLRYGGDYNPEQWSREVWVEDIRLMQQAGVNLVSIGIFSWVLLEPREGEYDFRFLDEIIGMLSDAGIDVDLATPTAAPPAWFWKKYPDSHPVLRDGTTLGFGSRGMVSPSSPEYRRAATAIASKLAERYGKHPAVVMWHVHNEYGAPISDSYDKHSVRSFRAWLQNRYGSLDTLNRAWGTQFWGQTYGEWDEIDAPRQSASVSNQAQRLDFQRFTSDALLACFVAERDAIRKHSDRPITTNFMATNCPSVDYWSWAREVDIVANDHYLAAERSDNHVMLAMDADLTRSLAASEPWILMEHSSSAVNWQPRNIAKRPGELARNSLQHVARGCDSVMFFQFRASRYGAEKFHSAMLPHAGENSRIWREIVDLGRELGSLDELTGSRVTARVAIVWSIESFWAMDLDWRPSADLEHRDRIESIYTVLWRRGVTVDFVHPGADLSAYDAVFAPSLYLLANDDAANVEAYVEQGGVLAVSYFSGIVDTTDEVPRGAYPGQLRDVLGIEIHEFLPLRADERVTLDDGATGTVWSDDIVCADAEVVARYVDGPAASGPAITRNRYGRGRAHYVSTNLTGIDLDRYVESVLDDAGVPHALLPVGLETVTRVTDTTRFRFYLNHGETPIEYDGQIIEGGQTRIVRDVLADCDSTGPTSAKRLVVQPQHP